MAKEIFKTEIAEQNLLADLSQLIEQSRNFVVVQANCVITMLFWNVGKRINEDILQNKRAKYGKQIVSPAAAQLSWSYFKGLILMKDEKARLCRMMRFTEVFSDVEIVAPLARQLSKPRIFLNMFDLSIIY